MKFVRLFLLGVARSLNRIIVARCEDEAQKELHMFRERNNQLDIGCSHWMGAVIVELG